MKCLVFLLTIFVYFSVSASQDCGMNLTNDEVKSTFNYRNQLNSIGSYNQNSRLADELITIPVKIHVVSDSSGNINKMNLLTLFGQICDLNELYNQVGFYFYLLPEINYIKDNRFIRTGGAKFEDAERERMFGNMMYSHYYYGALNVYYTLGTGICGMAPFPFMSQRYEGRTGVLMESNFQCSGPGSKTLAHEIGHHFDLLHPHQGWDSKDSRYSEYVTRTEGIRNCKTAGDGFCDTPADVQDFSCPYIGDHKDLRGDFYNPDVSLIMSYHKDICQNKFSDQQIAHMNSVIRLDTGRIVYLQNQIAYFSQIKNATLISPAESSIIQVEKNTTFEWENVEDAEAYLINISTGAGSVIEQAMVFGVNSYNYNFKFADRGRSFYWTVYPIKFSQPCLKSFTPRKFTLTSSITSLFNNTSFSFSIYPNPLIGERNVTIQMQGEWANKKSVALKLISLNGQVVQELIVPSMSNQLNLKIDDNISSGVYFLHFHTDEGNYQSKLIIQ